MNTVKITEANVQKAVCDLLTAKKIFWLRMNAGDCFGETNGRKWRIKGHAPGTADLLVLTKMGTLLRDVFTVGEPLAIAQKDRNCMIFTFRPLWIELKAPGKKQTPEQKEFQKDVTERGMTYLLVDDVQILVDWLKERGL